MKRFFGRREGNNIIFEENEAGHIVQVLRMRVGEQVIACLNDDNDYYCTLVEVGKKRVIAKIDKIEKCSALPKKNIVLFISMPKRDYFETIVTKSVELGVSEIQPFESEYSAGHDFKRERLNQIVMTACKQCERSRLVPVKDICKFNEMLAKLKAFDMVVFANEHISESQTDFESLAKTFKGKGKIAVVVGCEGGFSKAEADKIVKAGATQISLGARILRCDTAAVATLSIVNLISKN